MAMRSHSLCETCQNRLTIPIYISDRSSARSLVRMIDILSFKNHFKNHTIKLVRTLLLGIFRFPGIPSDEHTTTVSQ